MAIKTHRALSAALAGIAFAASAPFAYAAPQADADTSVTKPHVVALAQPRAGERQATSTAPLTMLVEDSAGNAVRLIHVPGTGWKYGLQTPATPSAGTRRRCAADGVHRRPERIHVRVES